MNLIEKIFTVFFIASIFFYLPNITFAEDVEISAETEKKEISTETEKTEIPVENEKQDSTETKEQEIPAETEKNQTLTENKIQEFSAEGEYRLGDNDTRASAKIKALDDAKRKIAEQIGVYVQSYSEMNKSELTTDQIRSVAVAMIKVKSEKVEYSENGTLCKVSIVADADTNSKHIQEEIKKFLDDYNNSPDAKLLEIAGIWEYNKHFYKVFNEGMNWYEAKDFCEQKGGHLVTITSREEQAAVQSILLYSGKKKNFYWTAGFSVETDKWEWTTREEFTYSNWAKGEPNNDLGNEFILSIYNSGEWNDCPADGISHIPDMDFFKLENAGFICEWENFRDIKV